MGMGGMVCPLAVIGNGRFPAMPEDAMMANLRVYKFRQAVALPEEAGWQRPFTSMARRAQAKAQLRLPLAPDGEDPTGYGRKLAELLRAISVDAADSERDLLLLSESDLSWRDRWFGSAAVRQAGGLLSSSVLLARQPRWPLRHLLVILRGQPEDETAVTWALRLAKAAGAGITLLPIIPAQPGYYNHSSQVQAPLNVLLTTNSLTGRCLQRQLLRLAQEGVSGTVQTQPGPPVQQIEQAVQIDQPDLILIAEESGDRFLRLWLGELVRPLLRAADRPVLVAHPEPGISR
jgi:nucleotide-binding universal stress UspA family protein